MIKMKAPEGCTGTVSIVGVPYEVKKGVIEVESVETGAPLLDHGFSYVTESDAERKKREAREQKQAGIDQMRAEAQTLCESGKNDDADKLVAKADKAQADLDKE